MILDYKEILKKINKKDFFKRNIIVILSMLLMAIVYNVLVMENQLILGGTSGSTVIFSSLFDWKPSIIVAVFNGIMLTLSLIFLDIETTKKSLICTIAFPLFVELTTDLSNYLIPFFRFDSMLLIIIVTGVLLGISVGMIFKVGYNTGGAEIITLILNKYCRMPVGKASFLINGLIIFGSSFLFGLNGTIYSIITIGISTTIVDRILIGISDSKMFFIYTRKTDEVKDFVMSTMNTGITILNAEGGFSRNKQKMIMCVVSNRDYFLFKESIKEIDPEAFFVINDCYEVAGGHKRANLGFI